ncbi:MAG: FmdE family protein [Thermomicrobiales bacterium]
MAMTTRRTPPTQDNLLAESAALHDHLCPRQVLGVRMGMEATRILDLDLPQGRHDKRLLTIVETDGCFADGISVATGCWLGHRTLRCNDLGKVAATFVDTETAEAIRIRPALAARTAAAAYAPDATGRWQEYLLGYQRMPASELLEVQRVLLIEPVAALVSSPDRRATCTSCGEEVFNGREVIIEGSVCCPACAGRPYLLARDNS